MNTFTDDFYLPSLLDDDQTVEVEYTIHPGEPEIMPEQSFYPDTLELLSVKNEAGKEVIDILSQEDRQKIEDACWTDCERLAKEYQDSF